MAAGDGYRGLAVREDLGTVKLLDEIEQFLEPDEFGRPYPRHIVIHKAFQFFLDHLKQEAAPQTAPK